MNSWLDWYTLHNMADGISEIVDVTDGHAAYFCWQLSLVRSCRQGNNTY